MCCPGSKGHPLLLQILSYILITSCDLNLPQNTIQRKSEQPYPFFVGDLESFKKQAFVLKEGVEYRIKISFRVRIQI